MEISSPLIEYGKHVEIKLRKFFYGTSILEGAYTVTWKKRTFSYSQQHTQLFCVKHNRTRKGRRNLQ